MVLLAWYVLTLALVTPNCRAGSEANNHAALGSDLGLFVTLSLSLLLLLSAPALLIYECSNTIEQRMILGSSNCERLTNVDTHNCYISKVALILQDFPLCIHICPNITINCTPICAYVTASLTCEPHYMCKRLLK